MQNKDKADDDIVKFFFANDIQFNGSFFFDYKEVVVKIIKFGPRYMWEAKLRRTILDKNLSKINIIIDIMILKGYYSIVMDECMTLGIIHSQTLWSHVYRAIF